MDADRAVRDQLLYLLQGGNAHMRFDEAIDNFPLEFINTCPLHVPYTPWRLLEHLRIAQWDILEFIRDPEHISPPWPEGYWPPENEAADGKRWENTVQGFRADHRALEDLVANPNTDLYTSIPHAPGYSILREILVVSDHNAYHLGEFALLRQVLEAW